MVIEAQPLAIADLDLRPQVLFKEARHRERRRRLGAVSAVVLVAGLGVGIGVGTNSGGTPSGPGSAGFRTPRGFALRVLHHTIADGSAMVNFSDKQLLPQPKGVGVWSLSFSVVSGSGVVNFADESMSSSISNSGSKHSHPLVQIGRKVYYQPSGRAAPPVSEVSDRLRPLLNSSYSPDLLRVISRPVLMKSLTLNGKAVTVYEAHTTLGQLVAVTNSLFDTAGFVPPQRLDPTTSSVIIPVRLWIDSTEHLVKIQATESDFTAHYLDHNQEAGQQVDPTWNGSPLVSLDKFGYEQIVVEFSQFGRPVHISAPITANG